MNMIQLRNEVSRFIAYAREYGIDPSEVEVSMQIDHHGDQSVFCCSYVEVLYDNDSRVSGCVLYGVNGYPE